MKKTIAIAAMIALLAIPAVSSAALIQITGNTGSLLSLGGDDYSFAFDTPLDVTFLDVGGYSAAAGAFITGELNDQFSSPFPSFVDLVSFTFDSGRPGDQWRMLFDDPLLPGLAPEFFADTTSVPGQITASGDVNVFLLDPSDPSLPDPRITTPLLYAFNLTVLYDISTLNIFSFNLAGDFIGSGNPPVNPVPVPEPGTLALLGSGLIGLVGYGRRKARTG